MQSTKVRRQIHSKNKRYGKLNKIESRKIRATIVKIVAENCSKQYIAASPQQ